MSVKSKAAAALLVASFLWGSSFVGSKVCLNAGLLPFETVFYRMLLGTVLMGLLAHWYLRDFSKRALMVGLLLGAITSAIYSFDMHGLLLVGTTKASFLTSTSIVMMPFLYALFFGSKSQLRSVLAALTAMTGVWFLCGGAGGASLATGDVLLLFTAFYMR